MRNGYLTIYLSLSLSIFLSLILTLVEGARISTMRMEAEYVVDIGMHSVLGEFHRELFEQYDLLFVDMTYGGKQADIGNSEEHLRNFMQKNFDLGSKSLLPVKDWLSLTVDRVQIKEYALASDRGGSVMRQQAIAYMKESTLEGRFTEIITQANEMNQIVGYKNVEQERKSVQSQIDAVALPMEEDANGDWKEVPLQNPADQINNIRTLDILNLVLPEGASVSEAKINPKHYISSRPIKKGSGFIPKGIPNGVAEKLLFDEYLFEKCGMYGEELGKSLLKYQIEYILMGEESDRENLKKIVHRLLLWREAANITYLLADAQKCAQAEALALTLTVVLQVPVLVQPVKYSLLLAWAYVESLSDVKTLLNGGKIPLMKGPSDWKTGIENILNFNGSGLEENDDGNGLGYKEYLRMMLFLQEDDKKNGKAMDIMEMDIRNTVGNEQFRMDACFSNFNVQIDVSSGFGYQFQYKQHYGFD